LFFQKNNKNSAAVVFEDDEAVRVKTKGKWKWTEGSSDEEHSSNPWTNPKWKKKSKDRKKDKFQTLDSVDS